MRAGSLVFLTNGLDGTTQPQHKEWETMKRHVMALAVLASSFLAVGCHHNVCNSCSDGGKEGKSAGVASGGHRHHGHGLAGLGGHGHAGHGHAGHGHAGHGQANGGHIPRLPPQQPATLGPGSGSYAYPYYTTRAPRDFLQGNPYSIGR